MEISKIAITSRTLHYKNPQKDTFNGVNPPIVPIIFQQMILDVFKPAIKILIITSNNKIPKKMVIYITNQIKVEKNIFQI